MKNLKRMRNYAIVGTVLFCIFLTLTLLFVFLPKQMLAFTEDVYNVVTGEFLPETAYKKILIVDSVIAGVSLITMVIFWSAYGVNKKRLKEGKETTSIKVKVSFDNAEDKTEKTKKKKGKKLKIDVITEAPTEAVNVPTTTHTTTARIDVNDFINKMKNK